MSKQPGQTEPNILFLFPDQWRWDWLGCEESPYGKVPVRTPNLDALARRGVRFTQCRTNSPLCAPARACLATGARYHRCGVPDNTFDLDPGRTTVFNLLRDAGYRTGTCGKNDLHKNTAWKGHDGWTRLLGQYGFTEAIDQSGKLDAANSGRLDRGGPNCSYTSYLHARGLFDTFVNDYIRRGQVASNTTDVEPTPLSREHYTDDFCGRKALQLLDGFPEEGPWLLWVNWPGPHDPFDPPHQLRDRYANVEFPPPVNGATFDSKQRPINHMQIRRNYAAECEGIDEWVGRIIDKIAERGELDNTLIVFSSDHGEMLGDHGRFTKQVPQDGSVRVPLIVAGPGVATGEVNNSLVELIDISATLLDFAGLPTPGDWDARSLRPLLTKSPPVEHRDVQVSELKDWRMLCDGRFKLVETQSEPARLFDLVEDPGETRDVADQRPDVLRRLSQRLRRELDLSADASTDEADRLSV